MHRWVTLHASQSALTKPRRHSPLHTLATWYATVTYVARRWPKHHYVPHHCTYVNSSSLNFAFFIVKYDIPTKFIKSSYRATNTRTLPAPQTFPSQTCWSETPMTHSTLQVLGGTRSLISFGVSPLCTLILNNAFYLYITESNINCSLMSCFYHSTLGL